jgi:hypothetical protein
LPSRRQSLAMKLPPLASARRFHHRVAAAGNVDTGFPGELGARPGSNVSLKNVSSARAHSASGHNALAHAGQRGDAVPSLAAARAIHFHGPEHGRCADRALSSRRLGGDVA